MSIKPVRDRIVVKPAEIATTTAGGIIIPNAKEKPEQGTVVAAGSGRLLENGTQIPLEVKVNDTVIYSKHAGSTVKIDGEEYVVLKEEDILAIVGQGE